LVKIERNPKEPESLVHLSIEDNKVCAEPVIDEKSATLTAELINEVFDSRNTGILKYGSEIRLRKLNETMGVLYDNLFLYMENNADTQAYEIIAGMMERGAEFSVFVRGYMRDNYEDYNEFLSTGYQPAE